MFQTRSLSLLTLLTGLLVAAVGCQGKLESPFERNRGAGPIRILVDNNNFLDVNRLQASPAWSVQGIQGLTSAVFGQVVGTAGDIDKNGCGDILITAPSYDNCPSCSPGHLGTWGRVFVWMGCEGSDPSGLGVNQTPLTADIILAGDVDNGSGFGSAVSPGDFNGNGYSDLAVGDRYGADWCFDPDTGYQEIAQTMGVTESTIKTRLHRARAKLAQAAQSAQKITEV